MTDTFKTPTPEQRDFALGAIEKIASFYDLVSLTSSLETLVAQGAFDPKDLISKPEIVVVLNGANPKLCDTIAELCFNEATRLAKVELEQAAWDAVDILPVP